MAKENWVVVTKKADFYALAKEFGISPMLARIIRNRDVISPEDVEYYLNAGPDRMHAPELMKDMEKGAQILLSSIREGKVIRVIGDYDADGVCASYILKKGLSVLGAEVSVRIPHRVSDGYGLNLRLIEETCDDGVDVIVTCDNGISAREEIAYAKEKGLTVVVTDHHEVPYELHGEEREELLPEADAVIDPKQKACPYPYKEICGALVAYKLIQTMFKASGYDGNALLRELMEFAAIATVCDVMNLLDENRVVVKSGLQYINESSNLGLRTLTEVCGISGGRIGCYHIGFVIGPCLNATGRLDTAMLALRLFEATTQEEALAIATELKEMNDKRKTMTEKGVEEAIGMIEDGGLSEDKILVVYLPTCHESIAGIIAGRLKEKYYKPTFVLTEGEQGLKGSGRSTEAYSMYDGLCEVKDLLGKFGGHTMAVGLSLESENLEEFRRRINENAKLTEEDMIPKVKIDIAMPIPYATCAFAEELQKLEPFGTGNRKPMFAQKDLYVRNCAVFGQNRNVAKFRLEDGDGYYVSGVYFGEADEFIKQVKAHNERIDIIYYPEINEYKGNKTLQIVVTHYKFSV